MIWDSGWRAMANDYQRSLQDRFTLRRAWLAALPLATIILFIYLYLFYRWFALANRYNIFLYFHDMGPLVPDTSPFSAVTSSRYWMAGLVAGGVVMLFYGWTNWLLGRLKLEFRVTDWWRTWLMVGVPLAAAIPAITMNANQPTLPLNLALWVTVVTLAGLALALQPGRLAAENPVELFLLVLDGTGLMLLMTTLVGLERLAGWLERGSTRYIYGMVAVTVAGILIMGLTTVVRLYLSRPGQDALHILLSGLAGAYLFLPLVHHISFSDGNFYITDADNFLARNFYLQALIWLLGTAVAFLFFKIRHRIGTRQRDHPGM